MGQDVTSSESKFAGSNSKERLVLLIKKTNFDGVEYELGLKQRTAIANQDMPPTERIGSTPLKPHQVDGFRWLVQTWTAGWPGVLLADDMGLGKTYQALAFLAWHKTNASASRLQIAAQNVTDGPYLIT
jgi:SNF2 family DNA or RNA helicase